jgi:hypothetical protein
MAQIYYQVHSNIATNTRPFWNKDYTNDTVYKFGLPRPIQHYRKSKIKPKYHYTDARVTQTTMNQIMDTPGQNTGTEKLCTQVPTDANFIGVETMIYHNNSCCQGNKDTEKALRLIRRQGYLNPSYSSTFSQYLQKRCLTFQQKSFNFAGVEDNNVYKPGAPNTYSNIYRANCSDCLTSCSKVVYKPSNYKFAKQGAVSSSLRTLQKTLETIKTSQYLNTFCNKTK